MQTLLSEEGQLQRQNTSNNNFVRMNLFFIKSKHAFSQFKNHDYFQNTRNHSYSHKSKNQNQFVQDPTPYGINNAYNYICTQASKNLLGRPPRKQNRVNTDLDIFQGTKIRFNTVLAEPKRRRSLVFPNVLNFSQKKNAIKPDVIMGDDDLFEINRQKVGTKNEQLLTFLYINKSNSLQKWSSNQIKINIYPHIINTFLKSRINYHQMTENQFAVLKSYIVSIYQTQKEYVQYKDMVNMRSLKEIFSVLDSTDFSQTYKKEMIRYFFIANALTYEYQLNKLKDQMKTLISFKLNKDISKAQIYIYHSDTSTEINNLHQLLKLQKKFIFGVDCKILNLFNTHLQAKQIQNKLVNRIRKWKSIAPDQNSIRNQTFTSIPAEKYKILFNSAKKKRDRFVRNRKKVEISFKASQFIDRSKLCKNDDIFQ